MAKRLATAGAACLGIVWGLWLCVRSVPRPSPPQPEYKHAPGWKLEVIAEAPRLTNPTAITVAPDGRVFVGQDPIDMAGPPDQPIDSVVCVHPDGRISVFATNLHCVFGLQYLDGKLYVNHAPKFSVFTDRDSVGSDRIDLFDYANPRQLLAGALTHIPAGIRWAMDGFIYMAVGDAGIYRAVGKDGRTLSLHGGGIIRFRPDGTELEIYATGTRNHPDLAINAEGEIFTYDNTDDGLGWWTRVTHMVDGGFYGYPWDYQPLRPYTLPMMGDYGGGAGTAAFAYNEDALPPEFQGNLFLGDYARSQMLRLRVEREGATYKILRRELNGDLDFVTSGASDFRPIGIAVSSDGMSLFVTDWNTELAMNAAVKGRLLKLTYTGESRAMPRPAWLPLAGTGKEFKTSTAELLAALGHPAQSVRLIAQRRLAEREAEVVPALVKLLLDHDAPAPARWGAIWALDAGNGGVSGRHAIVASLKDRDASVRRQAARQLGTRKVDEAVPNLIGLLNDPEASVRFEAATALGRIGEPVAVPALLEALVENDTFARYAAFTALNRIGQAQPQAWEAITLGLNSPNPKIREGVVFALRETYSQKLVPLLCAFATNAAHPLETRVAVTDALGEMARQLPAWNGEWWGATGFNPASRPRPAKTEHWEGTPAAVGALREALHDPQPMIRLAAVSGLKRCREVSACALLHQMVLREPDFGVTREILSTLGEFKDPHFSQLLASMVADAARFGPLLPSAISAAEQVGNAEVIDPLIGLADPKFGGEVPILAMQALARLRADTAIPAIAKGINDKTTNYWRAAISALGQFGTDTAAEALASQMSDSRSDVRQAILDALMKLRSPAAVPALLKAYGQDATRSAALAALTLVPDLRALDIYLEGLHSNDRGEQHRCLKALAAIQIEALPLIEDRMEREHKEFIPRELIPALQNFGGGFNVREWHELGPLQSQGVEARLNSGRSAISATVTDRLGKVHRWMPLVARPLSGQVSLCHQLQTSLANTNSTVYLTAHFTRTEEQEMELTAVCSAASGLELWLNGSKLATFAGGQPCLHHAALTLKRGENELLARIQNPNCTTLFGVRIAPPRFRSTVTDSVRLPKDAYAAWAMRNNGQATRGRKLFSEPSGAGCIRCHRVLGEGGALGPDLSGIGGKYNREQLIEAILYPSKQILIGYHQTLVTATDGDTISGLIQGEDADRLTLLDTSGQPHTIKKSQIAQRRLSALSPMPDGLWNAWSRRDFADVIAFLEGLKARP